MQGASPQGKPTVFVFIIASLNYNPHHSPNFPTNPTCMVSMYHQHAWPIREAEILILSGRECSYFVRKVLESRRVNSAGCVIGLCAN